MVTSISISISISMVSHFYLLIVILMGVVVGAVSQSAPAPARSPSGPMNITGILEKAGGYSFFIQLLNETQAADQIDNQVNNSRDGMTVFAPSDNAFNNLASGALNNLSFQQHVQLVQYHICPKFYSMSDLQTVSNPVRTQASGQDNQPFGLYFTARANQLNVSTGIVTSPVYNAVNKDFPLAVYQVDQVLLPKEFYEKNNATAPSAPRNASSGDSDSDSGSGSGSGSGSEAPSSPNANANANANGNGSGKMNVNLLLGIFFFSFTFFF